MRYGAMRANMSLSVVVAVLNEREAIDRLIGFLQKQTRLPDEVIFADGGSSDGTVEVVKSWNGRACFDVRVVEALGNISKGRNAGVRAARGDVIAVTDVDCQPERVWLEKLTVPFENNCVQAVAGVYRAIAVTALQEAIATFSWVEPRDVESAREYLPSHRSVAYRKALWEEIGGYSESIDFGEDTLFNLEVQRRGGFVIALDAMVGWQARSSWCAAFFQQVCYGSGDGQARIQLGYHGKIAIFVAAEGMLLFGSLRIIGVFVVLAGLCYWVRRHFRKFPGRYENVPWVLALALLLPPARLFGFLYGLGGNSARALSRARSRLHPSSR
jgi:glycosyltransferase involved in cell wall biosynthesis